MVWGILGMGVDWAGVCGKGVDGLNGRGGMVLFLGVGGCLRRGIARAVTWILLC